MSDFERDAALDGISLLGSIKSGLLVDVVGRGTIVSELAADARAYVRRVVQQRVGSHGSLSAAIVSAVLIGDRSGLPDDIRTRLQAAGTYHVIAISGGNIAILAALIVASLVPIGVSGRQGSLRDAGAADRVRRGGYRWTVRLARNTGRDRLSDLAPSRSSERAVAGDGRRRRPTTVVAAARRPQRGLHPDVWCNCGAVGGCPPRPGEHATDRTGCTAFTSVDGFRGWRYRSRRRRLSRLRCFR